ncbi:Uu.00g099060.m01.CDS01 [Anthostomella pinea]|uniref:Uu.00g099060.m01.CDS01 n=1 Tax=Anthostomella pinea TaxID=933095 RepID=A0AAI8VDE2_9PEZI|nr:Uu.00g099060.m01.CDS01 [Anthostomella pinea]
MASTRSSSPAGDASAPTSPQLTPRSKIQAMLAAIDDADSDDDVTRPIDTKKLFESIDKLKRSNDESPPTQDAEEEEDDDDDEEEIVRPRGRLAARMHANHINDTNIASRSPQNASKRASEPTSRPTASEHSSHQEDNDSDADDDEDISRLPRRRLARPVHSTTPEAALDAEPPSSPGLFVSPSPNKHVESRQAAAGSDSDDDLPEDLSQSSRFAALVAKKREERLVKEAVEERKREERAKHMAEQMPTGSDVDDDDVSDISDDAGGRRLTQGVSRPARKASKKALEEMNRETQRLSRSLQLAHEAKTKKKLSKTSLFERFNFRTKTPPVDSSAKLASSSRPTTPGSAHHTDVEMADAGTPPSSPPSAKKAIANPPTMSGALPTSEYTLYHIIEEDENGELPGLEVALTQSRKQDKGKGKAVEVEPAEAKKPVAAKAKRHVRVKLPPVQANLVTIDSDDELEVTDAKKGKLASIFDRLPEKTARESRSMHVLRSLAHLSSPSEESVRGRKAKPSMTTGELQMSLQQRARAQAKLERERRLEYLRSKGVVVQSVQERERERDQVEDIVARARQEVEEIMEREREDAKKARKEKRENGETDALDWDDGDDDSFQGSEEGEPAEIELSGSEDEVEGDDEDAEAEGDESTTNPMLMDEAEDGGESEGEPTPEPTATDAASSEDEEVDEPKTVKSRRPKKHSQIISDDEDEDEDAVEATPKPKTVYSKSPSAPGSGSPKAPASVLRSATKNFIPGLPVPAAGPAGMGLTQIFAGTMDDSQAGLADGSPVEFMPSFDQFPDSQFSAAAGQSQSDMVLDSQPTQKADTQARETQTQGVQLHFTQSQIHGFDSMQLDGTQLSDFIEPTQDGGFQGFSPLKQRFVEPPQSTTDTVLLGGTPDDENVQDSPLVRKRGKLRRRGEPSLSISSLPPTEVPASPTAVSIPADEPNHVESTSTPSAFRLMEKAARRQKRMQKKFDMKNSKANEMVHVQAEESEDEYAGLGGADGEDSSDEDEELVKEMIDDAAGNDNDEGKLAGLFADRERAADAAQVDKLFRDITTGMLRKRRRGGGGGNDFDLSDSEDDGQARRRMKQREFAKMKKALYADERISKVAENPRTAAFLKSIEDRNSDGEWDFDDNFAAESGPQSAEGESQSQTQEGQDTSEVAIPDSQPPTNAGRKRTRTEEHVPRPPPNARRTKNGARPSSLSDVRRELSSLLEEPNASVGSIIAATEAGSDNEEEEEGTSTSSNKENRAVAVVDRISLKRNSSSSLSTMVGTGPSSRLAFAAPAASGSGFKVPALLRRATTNSLMSNSSSTSNGGPTPSTTTIGGSGNGNGTGQGKGTSSLNKAASFGGEGDGKLKKNAGKRSGVNHFARENERRAKVAEIEKRREAKKWKGAEGRGKVVGGLFGAGRFE